jgi:sugar/nucleoside kinase (ribokinase family)
MKGKKTRGIAFAGSLIIDHLKFVRAWPSPGGLSKIDRQSFVLGGLVNNCAIDLAKLDPDVPIQVIGLVGEDANGDMILDAHAGFDSIDTSNIRRKGETAFTDVVSAPDGTRTFFTFMGSNADLVPSDFDFDKIRADILHIGYLLLLDGLDASDSEYGTALSRVLAKALERGISTSIDVVSEEAGRYTQVAVPALKYTDYCIINEIEAERITGIRIRRDEVVRVGDSNVEACVRALAGMGVRRWTVVHMPELSAAYDAESRKYHELPSLNPPDGFIVSSVGAGDAFAVGILYGAYRGWGIEISMRTASAIAAFSLSGEAASDAIRPIGEIMAVTDSWR